MAPPPPPRLPATSPSCHIPLPVSSFSLHLLQSVLSPSRSLPAVRRRAPFILHPPPVSSASYGNVAAAPSSHVVQCGGCENRFARSRRPICEGDAHRARGCRRLGCYRRGRRRPSRRSSVGAIAFTCPIDGACSERPWMHLQDAVVATCIRRLQGATSSTHPTAVHRMRQQGLGALALTGVSPVPGIIVQLYRREAYITPCTYKLNKRARRRRCIGW